MLSGRRLDLLEPSPSDGQTIGEHAFSVAQHSLLVTDIFESLNPEAANAFRLAALLHDAPEYVVGDLISPLKAAIGYDYKAFELRLLAAIHRRFGIPEDLPLVVANAIKTADRIAAYYEATRLAGFSVAEAQEFFAHADVSTDLAAHLNMIDPMSTKHAQRAFLARFHVLVSC